MGVLLTLFQPEEGDYAHHVTASTPGFKNLTTSSLGWVQKSLVSKYFCTQYGGRPETMWSLSGTGGMYYSFTKVLLNILKSRASGVASEITDFEMP